MGAVRRRPAAASCVPVALLAALVVLLVAGSALLATPSPAQASCAPQIVLDDVVYEPASPTEPIVLGAQVDGAFYPPCNDTSQVTDATDPVTVWRVQGLDERYLARGTEDYDLFVSTGEPYVPPVLPSAAWGRTAGWLLAIGFVAVLVAVVRAVIDRADRRRGTATGS